MEIRDSFNNPRPGVLFHQSSTDIASGSKHLRRKTFKSEITKGDSKKTLVRNTELTVYPTIYKSDVPVEEAKPSKKASDQNTSNSGFYKTTLSAPCLNSALRLVKEMKQASKARPSKSQSAQLVDEGKVLQQVNFLYEERLYHDLVALNVTDTDFIEGGLPRPTSKFRAREKDKEPQLSQFFSPVFADEYRIPRELPQRVNGHCSASNSSFSVYERMRSCNVKD